MIFRGMSKSPELQNRVAELIDRRRAPADMIEMPRLLGWMAKSVLRGEFGVVAPFLASGKRLREEQAEMARRNALYQATRAKFEPNVKAWPYAEAAE
jgi:hypothetical protein